LAEFNPNLPQVNDPELEAGLSRLLTIVGPLGRLNVGDTVMPVVNLADLSPTPVIALTPAFLVSEMFGGGVQTAPLSGATFADTGQLAAGTFDMIMMFGNTDNAVNASFAISHRNAADSAALFAWDLPMTNGGNMSVTYAAVFGQNERMRIQINANAGAGEQWAASVFAKRRV